MRYLHLMDPSRTATCGVLQDIPEAGHVRGDFVALSLAQGSGGRRINREILELISWLGRGWVAELEDLQAGAPIA